MHRRNIHAVRFEIICVYGAALCPCQKYGHTIRCVHIFAIEVNKRRLYKNYLHFRPNKYILIKCIFYGRMIKIKN